MVAGAPDASLDYQRQAGAERCPDREALRRLVTAQLGFDPFVSTGAASREVRVVVKPAGTGLDATVQLLASDGRSLGRRSLASPVGDCRELSSALVLAIGVALDPAALAVVKPVATTPAARVTEPTVVLVPTPAPPHPRRWVVAALAEVSVAEAPAVLAGPAVEVRWNALPWLSLGGGVEVGLPMRASFSLGQVTSSRVTGSVTPCAHLSVVSACVKVAAGALTLAGERVDDAMTSTRFFSTLAARVGLDVPLGQWLMLRALVELGTPLTRYTASVEGVEVWRAPWVYVNGGLGLGVRL